MSSQELSTNTPIMNYPFNGMRWEYRQKEIAKLIPQGSSVLDVGGGLQTLREFLQDPSDYVSMDVDNVAAGTVVVDLNHEEFPHDNPKIQGKYFDFAVCQGVLEYIDNIADLLFELRGVAKNLVVTYYQRDQKMELWRNNHRFEDIEAFMLDAGWKIDYAQNIAENSQRIFILSKK